MAAQIRINGAGGIGDAFHQVAQGLTRVQEALRLQEQEAQRRLQEAVRLQEERAATAVRQMEQQLRERDDVITALRHSLDERVQRLEARVAAVEERLRSASARRESEKARWEVGLQEHDYAARTLQIEHVEKRVRSSSVRREDEGARGQEDDAVRPHMDEPMPRVEKTMKPSPERRESEGSGEQEALGQMESRMGKLEGAVQRALAGVFPRVEALVERLESSPPGASLSSTSASTSSAPQLPATSVALEASVAEEAAADNVHRPRLPRCRKLVMLKRRVKEVERRMLRSRASPSHLGEALCNAIDTDEVRRLLDSGADASYTNTDGKCPLISAIELLTDGDLCENVPGIVSLLLAKGADPNSIDVNGMSALHLAIEERAEALDHHFVDEQCLVLLISAGADVNARNLDGATPLHLAGEYDDDSAVGRLLHAGANKRLKGWGFKYENRTPCELANLDRVIRDLAYR